MASVSALLCISLIVLFGCHLSEVNAGHHKGRGRGYGQAVDKYRKLRFSLVISNRRICRLQQELGWRLYRDMVYCDTGITVTDPTEDTIDPIYRRVFEQAGFGAGSGPGFGAGPGAGRQIIDNATRSTAYSLTRKGFCAHRAILATRSKYLENLISIALGGQKSWSVRHVYIDVIDIPPEVFEYILQYLYTYQIDNFEPDRYIIDLFVATHILQLRELMESIQEYLLTEMLNSIDQVTSIIRWIKWAQSKRDILLERALITVLRKVMRMSRDSAWQDFGRMMCEITQANYLVNLERSGSPTERPLIAKKK